MVLHKKSNPVSVLRSSLFELLEWLYQHRYLLDGHPLNTITVFQGFRDLHMGRLEQARTKFASALRLYNEDYRALVGSARLAMRLGDLDNGLDYWQRVVNCIPGEIDPNAAISDPILETAECLLAMYRFSDVRKVLKEVLENRPGNQRAWFIFARSYMRESQITESLNLWSDLELRFPNFPAPAIGKINCFIESENFIDAAAGLEKASAKWPQSPDLHFTGARLAFKQGSYEDSRSLLLKVISHRPDHIAAYALLQQALKLLGKTDDLAGILERVPEAVRFSEEFLDEVLVPHYIETHDMDSYRASLDLIAGNPVSARSENIRARYLMRNLEFERAAIVAEGAIKRFPYHLRNYWVLLKCYQQTNQYASLESLKISMRERFGESVAYPLFIELGAKFISDDLSIIYAWITERSALKDRYFSDLLDCLLQSDATGATYEILCKIPVDLTPQETVRVLGLKCQSNDLALLNKSLSEVVAWSEFEGNWMELRSRFAVAMEEYLSSCKHTQNIQKFYNGYLDVLDEYEKVNLFSRESYFEAVSAIEGLLVNIRNKRPTSLIRLGDGEGNFLPYRPELQEFAGPDQRKIQHIWWGQEFINGNRLTEMKTSFLDIIQNADFLGVPPPWRLIKDTLAGHDLNLAEHYTRGIVAITDLLLSRTLSRDKKLVSSAVSNDWYRWNLYQAIFSISDTVSYISCHSLEQYLTQRCGVAVKQSFIIPAEHAYREMFSGSGYTVATTGEESSKQKHIFPDIFDDICERISPDPGEVYLVAAGFLGKYFCDLIKNRGGIGIDIGSAADYWMGHETRRYRQVDNSFNPMASRVTGIPLFGPGSGG